MQDSAGNNRFVVAGNSVLGFKYAVGFDCELAAKINQVGGHLSGQLFKNGDAMCRFGFGLRGEHSDISFTKYDLIGFAASFPVDFVFQSPAAARQRPIENSASSNSRVALPVGRAKIFSVLGERADVNIGNRIRPNVSPSGHAIRIAFTPAFVPVAGFLPDAPPFVECQFPSNFSRSSALSLPKECLPTRNNRFWICDAPAISTVQIFPQRRAALWTKAHLHGLQLKAHATCLRNDCGKSALSAPRVSNSILICASSGISPRVFQSEMVAWPRPIAFAAAICVP